MCSSDLEELKDSEESPVLLSNNKFSESMEGVTESYGMPSRGEINPTSIVSVCYAILFGLMLSDVPPGGGPSPARRAAHRRSVQRRARRLGQRAEMKEAMAPKRIPLIGHTIQQMAHPLPRNPQARKITRVRGQ